MYSREHDKTASAICSGVVGGNFALGDETPSKRDERSLRADEARGRRHHIVTNRIGPTVRSVTFGAEMHNLRAESAVSYV
jgi:hypothetical protein